MWYPAIILAGCMGLRRSEALGMQWSRIDMEKREVLLDTKVQMKKLLAWYRRASKQ